MAAPQIELREDERGQLRPFLNGVALPNVTKVVVDDTAGQVRMATITMVLWKDQFEITARSTAAAIDCLFQLEWSAEIDDPQGGTKPGCPWCDWPKLGGIHSRHCKLALLINAPRADEPFDDEPRGAILR